MNAGHADAFVFFGATGDLARKRIFPALQRLVCDEGLDIPILGVARRDWSDTDLRARARQSLEAQGIVDETAFAKLASRLIFVRGDYSDDETYHRLRRQLGDAQRPLHYLAIPPTMFGRVAAGLDD